MLTLKILFRYIFKIDFCRNIMKEQTINVDSQIMGGTPVFNGTRVPVKNLFDYLESGETIDDFLSDFESVSKNQVLKVLEMSNKLLESSSNILNENIA